MQAREQENICSDPWSILESGLLLIGAQVSRCDYFLFFIFIFYTESILTNG